MMPILFLGNIKLPCSFKLTLLRNDFPKAKRSAIESFAPLLALGVSKIAFLSGAEGLFFGIVKNIAYPTLS